MNAEQAIEKLVANLVQAWNTQDAPAFCRLFDENANYVTGSGVRLAGRASINDTLFASAPSPVDVGPVELVTTSIKVLEPHVAVILCTWRMGVGAPGRSGCMTIVAQPAGTEWHILLLQNTDTRP